MILVTGGTGLVGSHLLYKLVSVHEKVRAIYRDEQKLEKVKNVFSYYTADFKNLFDAIEWVKADILDIPSLTEAFNGVSYVYHCAALVSFEPNKYASLRKINIEGTANIVNLSVSNNIQKLCYVSSIATLGSTLNNQPISEETLWNPEVDNNMYAITKYGAEMEVWRAAQEGLNAVIVNPGVILGAGFWNEGSGSVFKRAHNGLNFYPSGTIGLVSVEDVVAVMVALLKSDINNERFVLVAENWTYKKFLQHLATSVNKTPPTKKVPAWILQILWKLDWLIYSLTRKPRTLTKHLGKSLSSKSFFSNDKIIATLNFEFQPIDKVITKVGTHYLNDLKIN